MEQAGQTPEKPDDTGLGARLVALGGLELGEFNTVPSGPGVAPAPAPVVRTVRKPRTLLITAGVVVAVLGFFGTAAYLFVNVGGTSPSAAPPPPPRKPFPTASVGLPTGPQPMNQGVRTEDDLHLVCQNWYYPSAPRLRSSAPHPILISEDGGPEVEYRTTRTLNQAAFAGGAEERRAWAPEPPKAQLVACLDLTGPGRRVRDCGSGSKALPLVEGKYRLTVFEVASHRKLIDKTLTGADRACPFVILNSAGDTLYTTVKDRQLYDLLHTRVED
ncbi:hypothetical protein Q0Z83_108730 [Actinoplanes sichuanensis]|uniref:Serine/threonine protein kinase n=1 Tax=Actinoplanes sichuanensis TaxID=512349 RepID=A0ABW4ACH2_9ACTN|nr:hypothetical protein [Actinoplanes sichuanensis]BEL12682.1 hypothetical protein Q0Z83_108730 [Actinoplanes sichuanensis]